MTDQTPLPITLLPAAAPITGQELVPLVQGGVTKKALASALMVQGPIGPPGSGSGGIVQSTVVTLTFNQLIDLWQTPVQILGPQGDGVITVPLAVSYVYTFVNTAFASNSPALATLLTGVTQIDTFPLDPLMTTTDPYAGFQNVAGPEEVLEFDLDNQGIYLKQATGNPLKPAVYPEVSAPVGPILTAWVNAAGSGWVGGDTFSISGGGNNATGQVATVDDAGGIVTFFITAPGTGYQSAETVTITATGGSSGIGASISTLTEQLVDSTLTVTLFFCLSGVVPTDAPNNSDYAVTDGAIDLIRMDWQDYATGVNLASGLYPFNTLPVLFVPSFWRQNGNNPSVIDVISGNLFVKYPCIVEWTTNVVLSSLDVSTDSAHVTVGMSHSSDSDQVFGSSDFIPTGAAFLSTGTYFTGATGPKRSPYGDTWNTVLYIESAAAGTVAVLNQANIVAKVIAVLGEVLAFSVNDPGTGYAVGDYIKINNGYIRCIMRVDSIGGSGAVATVSIVDGGLGYNVSAANPTTALTGTGTGLKITITGVSN